MIYKFVRPNPNKHDVLVDLKEAYVSHITDEEIRELRQLFKPQHRGIGYDQIELNFTVT